MNIISITSNENELDFQPMAKKYVYCSIDILQSQEPLQVLYCIAAGELHEKDMLKVRD